MADSVIASGKNKGLASGAMVYLASNVLSASVPFLLLPILTRHLEPSEYGQVAMFQVLVSALAAFVGLNTVGAANRKCYDENARNEMAGYIGACFQILAISFLCVSAFLLLFQDWLADALGLSPSWILLAAVSSGASFVVRMRLGQWQVRKQALKYGALQISLSLFNAVLSLVLVVVLSHGPEGRMAGQTLAPVVLGSLAFLLLIKDGLVHFSLRLDQIKDALSFGVPLIPHIGGAFLLSTVDRFVINKHLGLDSAGIYMVAVQLTMAMSICFDAFNKAYVPWLFERLKADDSATKRRIVKWTYAYFVIVLMIAGLVFLIGPFAITLIAGEKYAAAGSIIGILALGQSFRGMYLMVTNYNFYSRKTGAVSLVTISCGFFNLLLLLLFVPFFGLVAAALASCVSMFIMFIVSWWVANISHPMPWLDFSKSD